MKRILGYCLQAALLAGGALLALPTLEDTALAHGKQRLFKATLGGYQEPPAVSSTGSGEFRALISHDEASIEYVLSYQDLEGDVTQSHIHVGQKGVNGGITIWICGTTTNPGPAGTPDCGGPRAGTVSRVVTAAEVVGPAGQGIAVGEFAEVVAAIRSGVTYVNIHSTRNAGGEIRGQIHKK